MSPQKFYEKHKEYLSNQDAEKLFKEYRFKTICNYLRYFEGYLYKNLNTLTDDELKETELALKFMFRIKELRQPEPIK